MLGFSSFTIHQHYILGYLDKNGNTLNHQQFQQKILEYLVTFKGYFILKHFVNYIQKLRVPWMAIIKSPPCWALLSATLGYNWAFYMLLTELPIYMRNIMHFDLKSVTFLNHYAEAIYINNWSCNLEFNAVCFTLATHVDLQYSRGKNR